MIRTGLAVILLFYLAACSNDREPPKENVFQTQVDALDKARAAEQKIAEKNEETRKRLESLQQQ